MTAPDPQVYLNGQFLPRAAATLDVEDRGALFGDGVYEVTRYYRGRPLAMAAHLQRLRNSLAGICLPEPPELARLPELSDELVRRNGLAEAKVYWQITRGAAPPRDHVFPAAARPTVLLIAWPTRTFDPAQPPGTLTAILAEDERWHRCNLKTLMLLPNVLAKNRAKAAGAGEAILHRGDRVTEGSSNNVFAVRAGALWTHPADQWVLPGVTRGLVCGLCRQEGIPLREEPFTRADLRAADEAFLTGTTTQVTAITALDGRPIGSGGVGPITQRLHEALVRRIVREVTGDKR